MKRIIKLTMTKLWFSASLLCFVLLFPVKLLAQTLNHPLNLPVSKRKTLQAGNTIPEEVWNMPLVLHYFDGKSKKVQLSDYKGKIIVFDFWSTSCASCIEGIPKLELIQNKFKDNIVILMVNSKRNKDTPKGIKSLFKRYKANFNYVPVLPTILDDTVFTKLFQHNVLPTIAIINSQGEFVATTSAGSLSDENVNELIKGKSLSIKSTGYYMNVGKEGRGGGGSLFDTVSTHYYSIFAKSRDGFLDSYPNFIYRNGTTYLRMGNQSLSFLLKQAYPFEMKGFNVEEAYFAPELGLDFKIRLNEKDKDNSRFWYEFFSRDSVTRETFREIYQRDFAQYFKLAVKRRKDTAAFYQVSFSPEFENLKTKHTMRLRKEGSFKEDTYLQSTAVFNVMMSLSYCLDVPVVMDPNERTLIDISIPVDFAYRNEKEKLEFLRAKGIILTKVKSYREYPYIYSLK